jgi:hypothetical protein
VTGFALETNACVKRIVATADAPAPITIAASTNRQPRRKTARNAGTRNGSVTSTSTTCSPNTIVETPVECASGRRNSASVPQSIAATATSTMPVDLRIPFNLLVGVQATRHFTVVGMFLIFPEAICFSTCATFAAIPFGAFGENFPMPTPFTFRP